MKSKEKTNNREGILKRMVLRVIRLEKELEQSKQNINVENKEFIKINSEKDLLKKKDIAKEYGISEKTVDRMRIKGLKSSQKSQKATVWILRKDLEDFLKKDRYDR